MKRPLSGVALFLAFTLILLASCERPEDEIGLQLQPDDDILEVGAVDTFTVNVITELDDTVRTDKLNPALVGAYQDPHFGFTKSGHVTEIRLSSINPDFFGDTSTVDDIQIDSLILSLGYSPLPQFGDEVPAYGNGLNPQYFQAFEITDSLSSDSVYYEYTTVDYIDEDLIKPGFNLQRPRPFENAVVGGDTLQPQMRIPLKEELGYRFLEASADGTFDNSDLLSEFKGLYLTVDESMTDPNTTGLLYFDTFTGASRIVMYYKDTRTGEDSLRYSFLIRNNTAKFNMPDHNYGSADESLQRQLGGKTGFAKQDLYIQAAAGLKLRVDIPYIKDLADSTNIAINKAKLILPARNQGAASLRDFNPPAQLFIFGRNADGSIYQLADDANAESGFYDAASNSYSFIISRYLQQIVLGDRENHGLVIVPVASGRTANRVVLNGSEYPDPENPSNNLRLAITFTRF